MKFVTISDTHGQHAGLKLPPGDVLIHAGDSTMKGTRGEVIAFLTWMEQLDYDYKILIAGNHDFYFENASPEELQQILPANIIYLNDSMVTINGINIWGSPITPWFFNWAFNRHRGEEIQKHWALIPSITDILITHGPVFRTLDRTVKEQHVGCKDLLNTVQMIKPKVHICGHIHEAYGTLEKSGTQFINASILNVDYELLNKPIEFEL